MIPLLIMLGLAGAGWIGWRILRQPSPHGTTPTADSGTNWLPSDFADDRHSHSHGHGHDAANDSSAAESGGD